MATLEEQLAAAIKAQNDLTQVVAQFVGSMNQTVAAQKAEYDKWRAGVRAEFPVSPNMLFDTKRFTRLCGGKTNTETDIITAHSSPWGAAWYGGTQGKGTVKVVTIDKLAAEGFQVGGDLARAVGDKYPGGFYGSDFCAAVFDVTISSNCTDGTEGFALVLNQGCQSFTGWSRGEFITEASCFVNVISRTGNIVFAPHSNLPAGVDAAGAELGKGWIYKRASRQGWGGCHQPRFYGIGSIKVALALPYIGFGDHGNNYVWAGSVGRYSHEDIGTF